MRDKGYSEFFAGKGIEYVSAYHYLDDARYARQMIGSRKDTMSRKMMVSRMRQKGLSDEVIQEAMEEADWTDEMGLTREIRRRFSSAEQIESLTDKDRQKLLQSLMRKGYGYSDINHVIRHLDELEEDTLWN